MPGQLCLVDEVLRVEGEIGNARVSEADDETVIFVDFKTEARAVMG
jgi:hypothetical protein